MIMWPPTLLLVIVFIIFIPSRGALEFNRVYVATNLKKECSLRFHIQSASMEQIHLVLQFSSSINVYHPAILMDADSIERYRFYINEDSRRLTVNTRGTVLRYTYLLLDGTEAAQLDDTNLDNVDDKLYDIIRSVRTFGASLGTAVGLTYDGVFLLDDYSAAWASYNVMFFETSLLRFEYHTNPGELFFDEAKASAYTNYRFDIGYTLRCETPKINDTCLVSLGEGSPSPSSLLVNNDRLYRPNYFKLLIDLDSVTNYLPEELYLYWLLTVRDTRLGLSLSHGPGAEIFLYLPPGLTYTMHQSDAIVLGVDLLRQYSLVLYSPTVNAYRFWYTDQCVDDHNWIAAFYAFSFIALLVIYSCWTWLYNYHIMYYLVRFQAVALRGHYFACKQAFLELLVIIISSLVLLVTRFTSPAGSDARRHYAFTGDDTLLYHTEPESRQLLFSLFLLYYLLFAVALQLLYRRPLALFWEIYIRDRLSLLYRRLCLFFNPSLVLADMNSLPGSPSKEVEEQPPPPQSKTFMTTLLMGQRRAELERMLERAIAPVIVSSRGNENLANRLYEEIVVGYHDTLIFQSTPVSILRNAVFIGVVFQASLLALNRFTFAHTIVSLLQLVYSVTYIYYVVRYIFISLHYMEVVHLNLKRRRLNNVSGGGQLSAWNPRSGNNNENRGQAPLFIIILISTVLQIVGKALYLIMGYHIIHRAYFNTMNSIFTREVINAFIGIIMISVILCAIYSVQSQSRLTVARLAKLKHV